jgi:hypothetical protein
MINKSNPYHQLPKKDSHISGDGERRPRQVDQEFQGVISSAIGKAVSQYRSLLKHGLELELKRIAQGYEDATASVDTPVSRRVRSRLSELVSGEVRRVFDGTLYNAEQTIAGPIWLKAANKHWETTPIQADKAPRRQKPSSVPHQAPVARKMPEVNGFVERRTPGSDSPAPQPSDDAGQRAIEVPPYSCWIAPDCVQMEEKEESGEFLVETIEAYEYEDSQIESHAKTAHDEDITVDEQPRLITPASASFWILPRGEAQKVKEILIIEPVVQYAPPQPVQEQPEVQQSGDVLDEVLIENADILKTVVHDNDEVAYIALGDAESEMQASEQEDEAGEDLEHPFAEIDDFVEAREEAGPAIWEDEAMKQSVPSFADLNEEVGEIEQAAAVNEEAAETVSEEQHLEQEMAVDEIERPAAIEEEATESADLHEEEWSDDDDLTETLEEDDELTDEADPNAVFEGTVRLNIEAKGCIKEIVHFVRELRQKPELRLLRLVGNNKDGVDIWLGLREPLRLKSILPKIDGVSIVTKPVPHIGSPNERLLAVKLSPLSRPAQEMPRIAEEQSVAEPVAVK